MFTSGIKEVGQKNKEKENKLNFREIEIKKNKLGFFKKHSKKLKGLLIFILILIFISGLGFSFYWFSYMPREIRKECRNKVFERDEERKQDGKSLSLENAEAIYKFCMREHGVRAD